MSEDKLLKLSNQVGDFIRYWGFRRIHGQIWTLLFLTDKELNPTQMATSLDVSKGLITSALVDLEGYELIERVPSENNKKVKYYKATDDVIGVIQKVLATRELKLVQDTLVTIGSLEGDDSVSSEKLNELKSWTEMAVTYVGLISSFEDLGDLAKLK